ncbi:hypothetical protein JB92DRAFT_142619 [Gautieria morchelliformis]|nr:hypothetical protein JB92DRAFT_142619 [Gautieria morchelliformis]
MGQDVDGHSEIERDTCTDSRECDADGSCYNEAPASNQATPQRVNSAAQPHSSSPRGSMTTDHCRKPGNPHVRQRHMAPGRGRTTTQSETQEGMQTDNRLRRGTGRRPHRGSQTWPSPTQQPHMAPQRVHARA